MLGAYVLIVMTSLGGYINGAPVSAIYFGDQTSCEAAAKIVRDAQRKDGRYSDSATCVPTHTP